MNLYLAQYWGSYRDCDLLGIYSTLELAQACCERYAKQALDWRDMDGEHWEGTGTESLVPGYMRVELDELDHGAV
jgi:hypothetical protein